MALHTWRLRSAFHARAGNADGSACFRVSDTRCGIYVIYAAYLQSRWSGVRAASVKRSRQGNVAELLLNYRLQMRVFCCNCGASNANKTNENRSVRTGQVELANRRLPLLCKGARPRDLDSAAHEEFGNLAGSRSYFVTGLEQLWSSTRMTRNS
jgi:hypothetical protein